MYSYGQFCKTPIGRMRVRKALSSSEACDKCIFINHPVCNKDLIDCREMIPMNAYFEKPNVGGKDQHK